VPKRTIAESVNCRNRWRNSVGELHYRRTVLSRMPGFARQFSGRHRPRLPHSSIGARPWSWTRKTFPVPTPST